VKALVARIESRQSARADRAASGAVGVPADADAPPALAKAAAE
jgi:hypothetical protein